MKKFLSLVLALVMTMSLVTISAGAKDFTDDSKIEYKEAVDVVSEVGIVDGYEDGAFNPGNTLTRGAAAKIICNLILGPTTASALSADTAPYKDVPTSNNFAGYIAYCAQQGIISGYADGTFRPAGTLTGYAFMKMLLGALGYDSQIEGFVGANWSVQVGKLALGIGLDDGNDDFVGTKAVTREEACLYAFNTLQATLVEYDSKVTANVNGVEVTVGNSKAQDVSWGSATNNDGNIDKDGYVQFAERYFDKLKLEDGGSDDFARPSNIWTYKADKIGTYAKTPDATYAKNVKLGDVYADLGMSKKDEAEVYINGVAGKSVSVSKANDVKIASDAANKGTVDTGTTVEVFRDEDTNDVTICVIDNYVGSVSRSVAAKGNKDAYVVITNESETPITSYNNEYETEESFDDDAIVLFTYSASAKEIKSVVVAESVTGTLTKKTDNKTDGKSLTLDDKEYKVAKNVGYDSLNFDSMTVKSEYTSYLDQYGNVIYVAEEEFVAADYGMIMNIEGNSDASFYNNRVKLLTAEGLVKTYDTDKDYTSSKNGSFKVGQIVTYKVNEDDGDITLRKTSSSGTTAGKGYYADDLAFELENGTASIKNGDKTVYANSKTVFVVYDGDDYKAYTGIKSVPSIKAVDDDDDTKDAPVGFTGFCKTSNMLTVAFIDASASGVVFDNSDVIFLAGESRSDRTTDNDGVYYTYNAVINGKITETKVKVDENANLNVADSANDKGKNSGGKVNYLFNGYSDDKYDIITSFNGFKSADTYAESYKGTIKMSGEYTIGFGTDKDAPDARYTVAEDAKIYKVDDDGNITEATLKNIATDANDTALYVVDEGQITYLFVQEINDDVIDNGSGSGSKAEYEYTTAAANNGNVTVKVTDFVRPSHVPMSAEATIDMDIYSDGAYIDSVSVVIPGGKTSGSDHATNTGLTASDSVTVEETDVTYDAVKVEYVDAKGNDVTGQLVKGYDTTVAVSSGSVSFQVKTTSAVASLKYTVKQGDTELVSETTFTTDDATEQTATVSGATDKKVVTVVITGLDKLVENYTVTVPGDKIGDVTISASDTTVTGGSKVAIRAAVDSIASGKYGYLVEIANVGSVVLAGSKTTDTVKTITVDSDVVIKAEDVKVTVIDQLDKGDEPAKGTSGSNTIVTFTFNKNVVIADEDTDVVVAGTDLEVGGVSVSGKTVVVTLIGTIAGNDTVAVTAADADYEGNTATVTYTEPTT